MHIIKNNLKNIREHSPKANSRERMSVSHYKSLIDLQNNNEESKHQSPIRLMSNNGYFEKQSFFFPNECICVSVCNEFTTLLSSKAWFVLQLSTSRLVFNLY